MEDMILIAPCHFGLEAVLKREIQDLGYRVVKVDDGRVSFAGDEDAVAEANIHLRTAERILVQAGEFTAATFDELFDKTAEIPWEEYLPRDAKFWVKKVSSVRSALFSPPDIQSIIKKAMVERMKKHYRMSWFEESGAEYPLRVSIKKDLVTIGIDTSGASLHKRGYRQSPVLAPISETLAAALIMLTPWREDRILVDPCCGSGTFPIEAAMMAAKIAPGLNRTFEAENWESVVAKSSWKRAREEARSAIILPDNTDIQGYDIDEKAVRASRENAKEAGVEKLIHFQVRPLSQLSHPKKYGFLIANPPYGERMEDREALPELYKEIGDAYRRLDSWSMYIITAYEDAEQYIGMNAAKNRKIYNGMIKTFFYQFPGPKPPSVRAR